ncbi:MAG TPA: hypothetical protein VK204_06680 [Nocardioidaceae bacterium]|jgi:hypothetical protein|nr:hypothetical protein [Nocardioidaceae bacterium]
MVGGLLRILGCTALASIIVGGVLYARQIAVRAVQVGRRLHLVPPPPPAPMGPPLERLVRDLRRLEPEARRPREGTTHAKHRGVVAAYDDLLLDACRAVDVPTSLASLPEGIERESERLRIEFELERAGLPIRIASP